MNNDRNDEQAEYRRTKRKLIAAMIFAVVILLLIFGAAGFMLEFISVFDASAIVPQDICADILRSVPPVIK